MNSTRFIFIGVVVVVLLLGGIMFTLLRGEADPAVPTGPAFPNPGTRGEDPVPTPQGEELTLTLQGGKTVVVPNFTQAQDTKVDSQNPGFYLVGQGPSAIRDASFDITYIAATDFFNISLMQMPIRDARLRAEKYLMGTLGLDADAMCQLRYSVATPAFVDESYTGTDLRFSFCADAVAL